jgi:hypothetical protein
MFIAPPDDVLLQQALKLADPVEIFPAYPRKIDSALRTQPLEGTRTDFEESADFVTVHPAVFFGLFLNLCLLYNTFVLR